MHFKKISSQFTDLFTATPIFVFVSLFASVFVFSFEFEFALALSRLHPCWSSELGLDAL